MTISSIFGFLSEGQMHCLQVNTIPRIRPIFGTDAFMGPQSVSPRLYFEMTDTIRRFQRDSIHRGMERKWEAGICRRVFRRTCHWHICGNTISQTITYGPNTNQSSTIHQNWTSGSHLHKPNLIATRRNWQNNRKTFLVRSFSWMIIQESWTEKACIRWTRRLSKGLSYGKIPPGLPSKVSEITAILLQF